MTAPENFPTEPLSELEVRPDGDRWTLIFVRTLPHAPEQVWQALTDPVQLSEWAPFDASRNLATQGNAVLTMAGGGAAERSEATVRLALPPKVLEYTWGDDILRWELEPLELPDGLGTSLTLNHTMVDREWLPKVAAGWHICLVVADSVLDHRPLGRIVGQNAENYGWQELCDSYQAMLDARRTSP